MIVTCPNCSKQYLIEEKKLPRVKSAARCKDCGARIIIDPDTITAPATEENERGTTEPASANETSAQPAESAAPEESFSVEALTAVFPWLGETKRGNLDLPSIFTADAAKGFATRRNRRAAAALKAVYGCLPAILAPDEKILKSARGDGYFPAEIPYANTILTLPANRFSLLCTDRRLLVINLDWRRKGCGEFFYQFPYANIRETGRGIFRDCLTVKSRSGRVMRFTGLTTPLAREMEEMILDLRRNIPNWNIAPVAPECLCPACYAPQDCASRACSACGAAFKSPAGAFYRSLALPGLGAAYLRHRLLAAAELVTLALLLTAVITASVLDLKGGAVLAACVLVLFMAASSLCAFMLGRKGLMLARSGTGNAGETGEDGGEELQNHESGVISRSREMGSRTGRRENVHAT